MLTADEVRGKRFTVTTFREGYQQGEVDSFLDRVATTLERRDAPGGVAADDVVQVRFRPTKLSVGYDQDEVDDFLDRVVATLRAGDGAVTRAPTVVTAPQVGGDVPVLLRVLQVITSLLFLVGLGLVLLDRGPFEVALGVMVVSFLASLTVQLLVFRAEKQPPNAPSRA